MTHPDGEFLDFDPFQDGDLSYKSANFSIEKLLATANVDPYDPEATAKRNFAAVLLTQYVNDISSEVISDDSFSQKEAFDFHRVLTSLVEMVCDDPDDQQVTFERIHQLLKVDIATPYIFVEEDYACTGLMTRRPYLKIYPEDELGGLELGVDLHVADQFPGEPGVIKIGNIFWANLDPHEAGPSCTELFFGRDMLIAARAIALNTMYCPEADDNRIATLYHAKQAIDSIAENGERLHISDKERADLTLYKGIIESAEFNHRLKGNTTSRNISRTTLQRCVAFDLNNNQVEPIQGFN